MADVKRNLASEASEGKCTAILDAHKDENNVKNETNLQPDIGDHFLVQRSDGTWRNYDFIFHFQNFVIVFVLTSLFLIRLNDQPTA